LGECHEVERGEKVEDRVPDVKREDAEGREL
jgi:hypothetical protein